MNNRIAAITAAALLGAASISSAMAFDRPARYTAFGSTEVETTGSFNRFDTGPSRNPGACPMSSAAEGNANQQHFPVKQYGQTAGGNRC